MAFEGETTLLEIGRLFRSSHCPFRIKARPPLSRSLFLFVPARSTSPTLLPLPCTRIVSSCHHRLLLRGEACGRRPQPHPTQLSTIGRTRDDNVNQPRAHTAETMPKSIHGEDDAQEHTRRRGCPRTEEARRRHLRARYTDQVNQHKVSDHALPAPLHTSSCSLRPFSHWPQPPPLPPIPGRMTSNRNKLSQRPIGQGGGLQS